MNVRLRGLAEQTLDRWILLHRAEVLAEALPPGRRGAVVAAREAARTRVEGALGEHGVPALLLVRAAIPLALETVVTARGTEPPAPGTSLARLWEQYDELVTSGLTPAMPASLTPAREQSLAGSSLDAEIAEHGDGRTDEGLALVGFLLEGVELRSVRAIRIQRRLRKLGVLLAGVAIVWELIAHRPRGGNLAAHANVVSSSRRPGSGPPQDLTNGKVEPGVTFSTKDEPDPWITVDLTTPTRVSEVTLFNGDEHKDDSLPIRVETSADGSTWEPAGVQTAHFSSLEPGVLSFTTRSARFVRVHGKPNGAVYLNEVEVR